MINAAMMAMQQMDVTDVKGAGTLLVAWWAALSYGDWVFQLCVGLGTGTLLWLNVYGKVLDNRIKQQKIADHEAERSSNP